MENCLFFCLGILSSSFLLICLRTGAWSMSIMWIVFILLAPRFAEKYFSFNSSVCGMINHIFLQIEMIFLLTRLWLIASWWSRVKSSIKENEESRGKKWFDLLKKLSNVLGTHCWSLHNHEAGFLFVPSLLACVGCLALRLCCKDHKASTRKT